MSDELTTLLLDLDNEEVAIGLAHNPSVSSATRLLLARHRSAAVRAAAVREHVYCDADSARDLLTALAVDPEAQVRSAVAQHEDTPAEVRARLATDPDTDVRIAVAVTWLTPPPEVHRALLTDPAPSVRAAAAALPRIPPEDLHAALLAAPETRQFVARHVRLTSELAAALARDPNDQVRAAVTHNPGLPHDLRIALEAEHSHAVRHAVLVSQHTDTEARIRLYMEVRAGEQNDDVWHYVASSLATAWLTGDLAWATQSPAAERLALLDTPLPYLRCALATTVDDLPGASLAQLLADPDPDIQKVAALSAASVPPADLERIVREHGDIDKLGENGIMARPDFPGIAFPRYASSPRAELRYSAATHDLPAAVLESLATADPDPHVRAAAAANPGLPAACLPRLLNGNPPRAIAQAVGSSPNFPAEWTDILLADENL